MGRDSKQGKSYHGKGDAQPSKIYGSSDTGGSSNSRRRKDRSAPPLPSKSGGKSHGVEYTRLSPPLPAPGSTATRSSRSRRNHSSETSEGNIVAIDSDAPLDVPEDKLEDVLPHVPVSDGAQRLLSEAVDQVDRSPLVAKSISTARDNPATQLDPPTTQALLEKSALPPNSGPLAKPLSPASSVGVHEADKKRPYDETDVGVISKKSRSPPSDIQEALREQPLNKEKVIEMISSAIGPWKSRYASGTPPDLEILIGRLQAVVAQLQGNGGGPLQDTHAPERVLSLIGKLDAALVEIASVRRRLEKDGPRLEEHVADLASVRHRQEKQAADHLMMAEGHRKLAEENKALAEKHAKLAAQAEKRAHVLAEMTTSCTRNLEAHEHAVRISSEEIDLYAKRREEADAFLAADGTLPEISIVLSYRPLE
ncbi:hypothetical protein D1007_45846 [Hordeum vulgare]|nr:hypothetical protein D1007_45846 [Hordeum vulgare]